MSAGVTMMNTLDRGRGPSNRVVELDDTRRYRREQCECEAAIHRAKQTLSHFVTEKFRLSREFGALESALREHEIAAGWAEQAGDEVLAAELNAFVNEQRSIIRDSRAECRQLEAHESGLSKSLRAAMSQSASNPYGPWLPRALENLQRATRRLNSHAHFIANRVAELNAWLEGIRAGQADFCQHLEALQRQRARRADIDPGGDLLRLVSRDGELVD